MTSRIITKFALGAAAAATAGGAVLAFAFAGREAAVTVWAVTGFLAMAVPGVLGGAWLAHEHGRPGSRFVVALGVGFMARLLLAALAAVGAARAGGASGLALLAGLAAGFLPVFVFEMIWFARSLRGRLEPRVHG